MCWSCIHLIKDSQDIRYMGNIHFQIGTLDLNFLNNILFTQIGCIVGHVYLFPSQLVAWTREGWGNSTPDWPSKPQQSSCRRETGSASVVTSEVDRWRSIAPVISPLTSTLPQKQTRLKQKRNSLTNTFTPQQNTKIKPIQVSLYFIMFIFYLYFMSITRALKCAPGGEWRRYNGQIK